MALFCSSLWLVSFPRGSQCYCYHVFLYRGSPCIFDKFVYFSSPPSLPSLYKWWHTKYNVLCLSGFFFLCVYLADYSISTLRTSSLFHGGAVLCCCHDLLDLCAVGGCLQFALLNNTAIYKIVHLGRFV